MQPWLFSRHVAARLMPFKDVRPARGRRRRGGGTHRPCPGCPHALPSRRQLLYKESVSFCRGVLQIYLPDLVD